MKIEPFYRPIWIGLLVVTVLLIATALAAASQTTGTAFRIPDTGQTDCYGADANTGGPQACPAPGERGYGQDAQYRINSPHYVDNGDGTVTDTVTGLMWQKGFTRNVSFGGAPIVAESSDTGGYRDWRVPTIKELYSLMDFKGSTGLARPESSYAPSDAVPFIDTNAFDFEYPSTNRYIDAQYLTSTAYTGLAMGQRAFFGVNFADGRIKGYPQRGRRDGGGWYLRLVRGNPAYGKNDFHDNGDGTIADRATGLQWMKADSGDAVLRAHLHNTHYMDGRMDWPEALTFCEGLSLGGKSDWRLPNAKELQSIVDYSRSPEATHSAAIDPVFSATEITDEAGKPDFPGYWSSTTHLDGRVKGASAVVVYFGEALGTGPNGRGMGGRPPMGDGGFGGDRMGPPPGGGMFGSGRPPGGNMGPPPGMSSASASSGDVIDVHGAGAQRSDPKTGDAESYPVYGHGPQGDVQRVYNYVRCVRTAG